ncbi:hypothetical protein ACFVYJ_04855 [Pontibacter sp. JAM-7]|uniref:hypothetical protein n=1 Tax=Pontibacter sp. JAM-7 TaxID=3366581 RepID=UPI003AF6B0C2
MKKLLLVGIPTLLLLGLAVGAGLFIRNLQQQLVGYQEVGSLEQMQVFNLENQDLKLARDALADRLSMQQKAFVTYRQQAVALLETQAVRRLQTAPAALLPSTGPMVLAATATQIQQENCQQVEQLLALEMQLYGEFDPAAVMQKQRVCDSFIEGELLPLVRVRMLSLKASLGGDQGHLSGDVDDAFIANRNLLQQWNIPVSESLERQLKIRH